MSIVGYVMMGVVLSMFYFGIGAMLFYLALQVFNINNKIFWFIPIWPLVLAVGTILLMVVDIVMIIWQRKRQRIRYPLGDSVAETLKTYSLPELPKEYCRVCGEQLIGSITSISDHSLYDYDDRTGKKKVVAKGVIECRKEGNHDSWEITADSDRLLWHK